MRLRLTQSPNQALWYLSGRRSASISTFHQLVPRRRPLAFGSRANGRSQSQAFPCLPLREHCSHLQQRVCPRCCSRSKARSAKSLSGDLPCSFLVDVRSCLDYINASFHYTPLNILFLLAAENGSDVYRRFC